MIWSVEIFDFVTNIVVNSFAMDCVLSEQDDSTEPTTRTETVVDYFEHSVIRNHSVIGKTQCHLQNKAACGIGGGAQGWCFKVGR